MRLEILLIRHGESEADILKVHEGRADFPLTEVGREQVRLMAESVSKEFPPDMIWASTLRRASETAEVLSKVVGCPLQLEEELMEFNNGIQAGMSFDEAKHLPVLEYLHDKFENGETYFEFRMRIETIFSKIVNSKTSYKRIAIVAHGGVINCLLRSFFNMPITKDFYFKIGDTGISLVELTDEGKAIHFINNTSHINNLSQSCELDDVANIINQ